MRKLPPSLIFPPLAGIPEKRGPKREKDKILNSENIFNPRVLDKDEPIKPVSRAIKRNKAGLSDTNRPIGILCF